MQQVAMPTPPREATPEPGSNLPLATSALVGRKAAIEQLCSLFSRHRLVTLTGLGGIGKTRLALEVAQRMLGGFGGDVKLVELAAMSDAGLVPSAVVRAVGIELSGASPAPAFVARSIGERRLLIVLDNCEHVIDAAAGLAEAVIGGCPNACILATSREGLRIDGEHIYRVPPLDVPAAHLREADEVLAHGAVQLFMERMEALNSEVLPRAESVQLVAAICRRLDGIPLAIELRRRAPVRSAYARSSRDWMTASAC